MLFKEYYFLLALPFFIILVRRSEKKRKELLLSLLAAAFYLYFGLYSLLSVVFVSVTGYVFGGLMSVSDGKRRKIFLFIGILTVSLPFLSVRLLVTPNSIGTSYYSLMAIAYLLEVANGKAAFQSLLDFFFGISFFPLMIQGPISDVFSLREEVFREKEVLSSETFFRYFNRLLLGYFKIFVIADRLGVFSDLLIKERTNGGFGFFLALCLYSLRLIMDFTGGIDVALGISGLMGIRLSENFDKPLFATSLADFWKRWHISLSAWFSKYIFYPLSLFVMRLNSLKRMSKKNRQRLSIYAASLVTWSLTGLWHGFGLNFLTWGLMNAFLLLLSYESRGMTERFQKKTRLNEKGGYRLFMMVRTFALVSLLRGFDRFESVRAPIKRLFSDSPEPLLFVKLWEKAGLKEGHLIALIFFILTAFVLDIQREKERSFLFQLTLSFTLFASIIIFGAYGKGFALHQFIYGRY